MGNGFIGYISVESFGAKGDGVTDDANAINDAYKFARTNGGCVSYSNSKYLVKSLIDSTGVSSFGDRTKIVFDLSSQNGYAFKWGGEGCTVSGIWFDLYNKTEVDMAIQGIINNTNNVSKQRFINNKITTNTYKANGRPNIYGLWISSTGLDSLYISNNEMNGCLYGIQVNSHSDKYVDVDVNPLGDPIKNIIIENNTLIDATIGINTPHIFCSNVVITKNTVKSKYGLEINLAHVTDYKIVDNNCEGYSNAIDSNIHIEDVCYNGLISGNELKPSSIQDGIRYTVKPGESSESAAFNDYSIITNNIIVGQGSNFNTTGVMIGDTFGNNLLITDNNITSVNTGLVLCGKYINATENTIRDSSLGINLLANTTTVNNNVFINCTNIISTAQSAIIQNSKLLDCINLYPVYDSRKYSTAIYEGVNIVNKPIVISSYVPYDLMMIPQRKFDLDIIIVMQNGFNVLCGKYNIRWDESNFTFTKKYENINGTFGGITLTKSNNMLRASNYVGSTSQNVTIAINVEDSIIYSN